jgi:hypothetical protein
VPQAFPSATQRSARQQPLAAHWLPGQQGWPSPPHGVQLACWQLEPARHVEPEQQGSPGPPQATHVPRPPDVVQLQMVEGSWHVVPQQGSPGSPQAEQRPAVHVPPAPAGPHGALGATHRAP